MFLSLDLKGNPRGKHLTFWWHLTITCVRNRHHRQWQYIWKGFPDTSPPLAVNEHNKWVWSVRTEDHSSCFLSFHFLRHDWSTREKRDTGKRRKQSFGCVVETSTSSLLFFVDWIREDSSLTTTAWKTWKGRRGGEIVVLTWMMTLLNLALNRCLKRMTHHQGSLASSSYSVKEIIADTDDKDWKVFGIFLECPWLTFCNIHVIDCLWIFCSVIHSILHSFWHHTASLLLSLPFPVHREVTSIKNDVKTCISPFITIGSNQKLQLPKLMILLSSQTFCHEIHAAVEWVSREEKREGRERRWRRWLRQGIFLRLLLSLTIAFPSFMISWQKSSSHIDETDSSLRVSLNHQPRASSSLLSRKRWDVQVIGHSTVDRMLLQTCQVCRLSSFPESQDNQSNLRQESRSRRRRDREDKVFVETKKKRNFDDSFTRSKMPIFMRGMKKEQQRWWGGEDEKQTAKKKKKKKKKGTHKERHQK